MKLRRLFFIFMVVLGLGSGCTASADPAASAVQQYLKSMVSADNSQVSKLVCKDFEDQASKDSDSFAGVKADVSGAVCKKSGMDGDVTLVSCTGKIVASYGNEKQDFDLAGPVYRVTQQGGSWLVCGRQ